jgi:hypothetical protein
MFIETYGSLMFVTHIYVYAYTRVICRTKGKSSFAFTNHRHFVKIVSRINNCMLYIG